MSWYLVKTRYRKTINAKQFMDSLGVINYVPQIRANTKVGMMKSQLLITGFIFVKFKDKINYTLLNTNPFTTDVIRRNSIPLVIPDNQMNIMINHVESYYNKRDFDKKNIGDTIVIKHGTLEGLNGTIIEIKDNKIYLQIDALSAKVEIQYQ